MKYNFFSLFFNFSLLGLFFPASAMTLPSSDFLETQQATVAHIIDGDTFVTLGGEHVRIIGINTPERGKNGAKAEFLYEEAKQELKKHIDEKVVTLSFGKKKRDKYKRLLANVYLEEKRKAPIWVNAAMIESGLAHVYSFPDTAGSHINRLIKLENTARDQKRGLWALPRFQVKNANTQENISAADVGQFHVVEGRVRSIADVKNRLYLNFGEDWRTDFTVEIPPKYRHKFKTKKAYMNRSMRIRGMIKPVNGYMITLTHPEQVEILDNLN